MKYGYVIITLKCFRDHIENRSLPRSPLTRNCNGETMFSGNATYLPSYRLGKRSPVQAVLLAPLNGPVSVEVSAGRNALLVAHVSVVCSQLCPQSRGCS